jgi:hypothetical protein
LINSVGSKFLSRLKRTKDYEDNPDHILLYRFTEVGGSPEERKKVIHCYQNVSGFIYVVDLA